MLDKNQTIDKTDTIVFASQNYNKLRELRLALVNFNYKIIPQSEFKVPPIAETGLSFVENALFKARNAAKYANLPALADDSGLEIDALNGAPGIYSARYAGESANSKDNVSKVLQELKHVPAEQRTARFHCLLVYLKHATDPAPLIAHGVWSGSILEKELGQNGFGYDPIFFVPTHNCSAAQLSIEVKNKLSHRGQALTQLINLLQQQGY